MTVGTHRLWSDVQWKCVQESADVTWSSADYDDSGWEFCEIKGQHDGSLAPSMHDLAKWIWSNDDGKAARCRMLVPAGKSRERERERERESEKRWGRGRGER